MTTVAVEKFADIVKNEWPAFERLLEAHWAEIAQNKELFKLNVYVPRYIQIASMRPRRTRASDSLVCIHDDTCFCELQ